MIIENIKKKIELLCPAGDLERLKTAVVFGADAIYCGLSEWSLRNPREITFTLKTLKEGIKFAHKHDVRVYITFNVFPHENQLRQIEKDLKNIKYSILNIDGIIVSDLGMLSLVKKYLPKVPIHISTQANTLNSEAILAWQKLGAERVVLARELTLKEIKEIRKKINGSPLAGSGRSRSTELEVFGHGAMCMAYSGRCLLSKYFTGREANLGDCAQSCRWRYKIKTPKKLMKLKAKSYYLEEETRPGDLLEIQEDPNGTYFMNSKEICSLDILDQFIEAGVDSFKIEGRAKSIYYLAVVTRVYRKAIDKYYELSSKHVSKNVGAALRGRPNQEWKKLIKELMAELNMIQHRGYSHGFLLGRHDYEQEYDVAAFRPPVIPLGQIIGTSNSISVNRNRRGLIYQTHKSGEILSKMYLVEVKNKFKIGDKIEIVTPPSTTLGTSDEIIKTEIKKIRKNVETNGRSSELNEILKPAEKVWVSFTAPSGILGTRKKQIPEGSILRKEI